MREQVTPQVIDALMVELLPQYKEGGPQVRAEASEKIDRLLDLRNQIGLRALGMADVEQL